MVTAPDEEPKVLAKFWNASAGEFVETDTASKKSKQKHQINSLAQAALAMESAALSRRSAGMKTKAQTYAKYGW